MNKLFKFAKWGGGILVVLIVLIENVYIVEDGKYKELLSRIGLFKLDARERKDYYCILGWMNTMRKLNYDAEICFFGNSITYHSDFSKYFPDKRIVNLGYPGDRLDGMMVRYMSISYVRPEKIFVMAGINDLVDRDITMEVFMSKYKTLIDSICLSNPNSNVYLESILPINHSALPELAAASTERILLANEHIKTIARKLGVEYVDLYSLYADKNGEMPFVLTYDGIHLLPSSYDRWASKIEKYFICDNDVR